MSSGVYVPGKEEQVEQESIMKSTHHSMKMWFNGDGVEARKADFGDFPNFWQELKEWPHWRGL